MAIRRGPIPADAFTIISNAWLRDPRLSWKAKGILAYIASHAPGHVLTFAQILAEGTDGESAVRAALVELEEAGYLRRIELRDEKGHRSGTDFELLEPQTGFSQVGKSVPSADQGGEAVSPGDSHTGKSQVGKSSGKKTTPPKKTIDEKTPSATPRGARLPKGWIPTPELRSWLVEQLPAQSWTIEAQKFAVVEHEKFTDYWAAAPGSKGVKADWDATWRNWMRKALEHYRPGRGTAPAAGFKSAAEKNAEAAERRRARAEIVDSYLDQGLPLAEAEARADADIANRLDGRTGKPYIDGVGFVASDQREVEA